jgi:RNA recognition motif-containing protein
MSLQERTLVVRNFDPDKTTDKLLKELCLQAGPLRKVVMRPDHAFVEFDHIESVGYAKALLDGVILFGKPLSFEPKIKISEHFKYTKALNDYISHDIRRRALEQQRQTQQYQMQMFMQQQQQQLHYAQNHQTYQPPASITNYSQLNQFQYQPPPPPPPNAFH